MTLEDRIPDLAIGAGLGGLACLAAVYAGPSLATSGWTSVGTGALLGTAALALLAKRYAEDRAERLSQVPKAGIRVNQGHSLNPSTRPAEWLSACLSLSPEMRDAAIRGKLADGLNPLARQPAGGAQPFADFADVGVALLAVTFCAHAVHAEGGKLARRLLQELDEAHRLPSPARAESLESLRAGLAGHLEPTGNLLKCYGQYRERHGTRESLLLGLLAYARKRRGVLASAEFVWLKGVDRGLWYALTNLGRGAFLVEGLAAMDHYHHEMAEGRPSREPRVDNAAASLGAIADTLARPGREAA